MCVSVGCSSPQKVEDAVPSENWQHPEFAEGFQWQKLPGDSIRLQFLDLNADQKGLVLASVDLPASGYKHLATLSTTHLNLLAASGNLSPVVAAAFLSYLSDSTLLEQVERYGIRSLGNDEPDPEVLFTSGAEAFLVYPFGGADYQRIAQAGIHVLPISEYLETHPLGRAEWMVALGLLTGRGQEAQEAFSSIAARYTQLADSFQELAEDQRPILFSGSQDGGAWFAPGGSSFISAFARDAGGKYLFEDRKQRGNISLDIEVFLQEVALADVWGLVTYSGEPVTLEALLEEEPLLRDMPFIKRGGVMVCNTALVDYFGNAIVEPDALLADLMACFHPTQLPNHTFVYFKPLQP